MAHKLYAYLDVDRGEASKAAVRLVERARRQPADPELFAGLVHACRYCGLLEASVAAHDHVRRLDAKMPTSVIHTYWQLGDYVRVAETEFQRDPMMVGLAWMMLGRMGDAADAIMRRPRSGTGGQCLTAVATTAQGRRGEATAAIDQVASTLTDPEGLFYMMRLLARLGEVEPTLALFERVVNGGSIASRASRPMRGSTVSARIRTSSGCSDMLSHDITRRLWPSVRPVARRCWASSSLSQPVRGAEARFQGKRFQKGNRHARDHPRFVAGRRRTDRTHPPGARSTERGATLPRRTHRGSDDGSGALSRLVSRSVWRDGSGSADRTQAVRGSVADR